MALCIHFIIRVTLHISMLNLYLYLQHLLYYVEMV